MVGYLIERQTERLTTGENPAPIQVVIDEADDLFSSDSFNDEFDVWVRLAMEGRKLRIGMTSAAQNVTGIAHQVLANTKNWVVTTRTTSAGAGPCPSCARSGRGIRGRAVTHGHSY